MIETVAVIDAGSGNLRSVEKALERASRPLARGSAIVVTRDPEVVAAADRVVLPGVGAFRACMNGLAGEHGLVSALEHAVLARGKPFLGICVGLQVLADRGFEFGETEGLGWLGGNVRPLAPGPALKTPHMGWNAVRWLAPHPVHAGIASGNDFYFLHSFHFVAENVQSVMGVCDYGAPLAAMVGRDNIVGVQFHPEKSQGAGLALLGAFLEWRP